MGNVCEKCGGKTVEEKLEEYKEDLLGIPVILRNSVIAEVCQDCGEVGEFTIPDFDGLIAAVAVSRIKVPIKLNGDDIRFLRKALGVNGTEFGQLLDVAKETVSRWENNKDTIGPTSEKLLRTLVGITMSESAPAVDFDPKEVLSMKVKPIRDTGATPVMSFERIKIKSDKRKEDSWDELESRAA